MHMIMMGQIKCWTKLKHGMMNINMVLNAYAPDELNDMLVLTDI